jgi:hypothetical protein
MSLGTLQPQPLGELACTGDTHIKLPLQLKLEVLILLLQFLILLLHGTKGELISSALVQ